MDISKRPLAPGPYEQLPPVPAFTVTSSDLLDGEPIPELFTGLGENVSPALAWSDVPEGTKSFVVNCFDPDAPTPAGFWHWTVVNLPADATELATGAGVSAGELPGKAFQVRNDGSDPSYMGPYPPKGDRPHRYYFAVHALDVEELPVGADASPTAVAFNALFHTIGRAVLMGTFQH